MVNRVAEDTLQEEPISSLPYLLVRAEVNEKDQELIVITKTYDLILWSCNHTSGFPHNHRFVLGERIERNLYNLLETLIAAKYTKNRQQLLEEANLSLEVLRFQMRLAKDLQCLKVESYGFAAKSIDEIGRLVGGWLRRSQYSNATLAHLFPPQMYTERPGCRIIWDDQRLLIELEGPVALQVLRGMLGEGKSNRGRIKRRRVPPYQLLD